MVTKEKLAAYLEDLDYPTSPSKMIDHAKDRCAPDDVMQVLHSLPNLVYSSVDSIFHILEREGRPAA